MQIDTGCRKACLITPSYAPSHLAPTIRAKMLCRLKTSKSQVTGDIEVQQEVLFITVLLL